MIIEFGNIGIITPAWVILLTSFILAFAVTYMIIPSIVKVSKEKSLFDKPDKRKLHILGIPTLGGAAVFLGMIIPATLFGDPHFEHEFKYIITGLLILFFIGIKDDILIITPKKKLAAEIFAISIIVILGNIRVTHFHGFLGIDEIPYVVSILFTVFMFIVIINGFNLIDGIDGLASSVGILTILSFGIWFLLIGDNSYAAFCFSAIGALLAFLRFNFFGKQNKIFLGDTGSLIIGMIVSIFAIYFLESSLTESLASIYLSAPAIAIGVLIVPLIDTLRVFTLRILQGKSPFSADRFHIHHQLLSLGFDHLKSTLIILAFNLTVIILSVSLRHLGNIKMLLIILPSSILITSLPGFIVRYRERGLLNQLGLFGNKSWILPISLSNLMVSGYSHPSNNKESSYNISSRNPPQDMKKDLEPVLEDTYIRLRRDDNDIEEPVDLEAKSDN